MRTRLSFLLSAFAMGASFALVARDGFTQAATGSATPPAAQPPPRGAAQAQPAQPLPQLPPGSPPYSPPAPQPTPPTPPYAQPQYPPPPGQYPPPQYGPPPQYPPAQPYYPYAPPPYYYGQPAYEAPPPARLRYVEGGVVPAGYHVEKRPRKGLVIAGAVVFGSLYVISASVAGSSQRTGDGYLLLPVFGPFIDLATRSDECTSYGFTCASTDSTERFWLTFDGIGQAAGATLLIVGLAAQEKLLERDDAYPTSRRSSTFAWTLTPRSFGKSGFGLGVQGLF